MRDWWEGLDLLQILIPPDASTRSIQMNGSIVPIVVTRSLQPWEACPRRAIQCQTMVTSAAASPNILTTKAVIVKENINFGSALSFVATRKFTPSKIRMPGKTRLATTPIHQLACFCLRGPFRSCEMASQDGKERK